MARTLGAAFGILEGQCKLSPARGKTKVALGQEQVAFRGTATARHSRNPLYGFLHQMPSWLSGPYGLLLSCEISTQAHQHSPCLLHRSHAPMEPQT